MPCSRSDILVMFHLIMKRLSLWTVNLLSSLEMLEVIVYSIVVNNIVSFIVTNRLAFYPLLVNNKTSAIAKQLVSNSMKVDFKTAADFSDNA